MPEATEELRDAAPAAASGPHHPRRGLTSLDVLAGFLVLTVVLRQLLGGLFDNPPCRPGRRSSCRW